MNWSEMDTALTNRAKETLELRDRVQAYRLRLEPVASSIRYETVFSVYHGQGVEMYVAGTGDRVARLSQYHNPDHAFCFLGTRDLRGNKIPLDMDSGILGVISYLNPA